MEHGPCSMTSITKFEIWGGYRWPWTTYRNPKCWEVIA